MKINYKLVEESKEANFEGMQPVSLKYTEAFLGQFSNYYAWFKQMQYLDGVFSYANISYLNQSEVSAKLSEAISFFSVPMLLEKLAKTYEAFSKLDLAKLDTEIAFTQASFAAVSQALKVAKFVQKIFQVVALSKYKMVMTVAQNSFEIAANGLAYYKIYNELTKCQASLDEINNNLAESDLSAGTRNFLEALKLQEQMKLNSQYAALMRTTSVICLSGLEVLSQLAITVTGADTIMLAGTTVLTATGLHDLVVQGLSKQIDDALDSQLQEKIKVALSD